MRHEWRRAATDCMLSLHDSNATVLAAQRSSICPSEHWPDTMSLSFVYSIDTRQRQASSVMLTRVLLVGGGLWRPEASSLAMMRRDIDRKPHRIKGVLTNLDLRKAFLTSSGAGKDEKAALKAFVEKNAENALKTKPKVRQPSRFHSL